MYGMLYLVIMTLIKVQLWISKRQLFHYEL